MLLDIRSLLLQALGTYFGVLKVTVDVKALIELADRKLFITRQENLVKAAEEDTTKKAELVDNQIIAKLNSELLERYPTANPALKLSKKAYYSYTKTISEYATYFKVTDITFPFVIDSHTYTNSNGNVYTLPASDPYEGTEYLGNAVLTRYLIISEINPTENPPDIMAPTEEQKKKDIQNIILQEFKKFNINKDDYNLYITDRTTLVGLDYVYAVVYPEKITQMQNSPLYNDLSSYVQLMTMARYGLSEAEYLALVAEKDPNEDPVIKAPDDMLYTLLGALQVGVTLGYQISKKEDFLVLYDQIQKGSAIVIQVKYILEDIEVNLASILSIITSGQLLTPVTAIHAILNILGCITRVLNNLTSLGLNTEDVKNTISGISALYTTLRTTLDTTVMPPIYAVEGMLDIASSIFFGPLAPLKDYMLPGIEQLQDAIGELTTILNSI